VTGIPGRQCSSRRMVSAKLNPMNPRLVESSPSVLSRRLSFWADPARVFAPIAHLPGSVLLESQSNSAGARYSIICTEPFGTLRTARGLTSLSLPEGNFTSSDSPFDLLRDVLSVRAVPHSAEVPFAGGAVGYLGYELRTFVEDSPISASDDLGLPDCWIGLYDRAIVFDHWNRTISLNACVLPGLPRPEPGLAGLQDLIERARHGPMENPIKQLEGVGKSGLSSSFTRAGYCGAVRRGGKQQEVTDQSVGDELDAC